MTLQQFLFPQAFAFCFPLQHLLGERFCSKCQTRTGIPLGHGWGDLSTGPVAPPWHKGCGCCPRRSPAARGICPRDGADRLSAGGAALAEAIPWGAVGEETRCAELCSPSCQRVKLTFPYERFFRASEMCFGQRHPGGGGCLPALWGARGFSSPSVPMGTRGPAGAQLEPLFGGVWYGLKQRHVSLRSTFSMWLVAPFALAFAPGFLFQAPSPLKLLQGCCRNQCTPVPGEEQGESFSQPLPAAAARKDAPARRGRGEAEDGSKPQLWSVIDQLIQ